MSFRTVVWLIFGGLLMLVPAAGAIAAEPSEPNVVIFLSDDQGWGDFSFTGNKNTSTPNIDSLAKDGALFDHFYVCPVCSPTRAEFLTGRYHTRGGVFSTSTGGERLDLDESTIGQMFQTAGYKTAAFGKWHNGMQWPYHPNARGFDEYYGFCSGHWGHYFSPELEHNGTLVRGEGYVSDDFTGHAIDFIEQHKADPFFVYVPYCTPHSPMQVPDEYWNRHVDKELVMKHREPNKEEVPKTKAALAMCENIDWNVGRVLKKLDELQLAENTIVIYFNDNGPNSWRWNADMRGRKGSTDEGGVRVPLLVRWPGHIEGGTTISQIASAMDLMPTLSDLCGVPIISTKTLDGHSLAALLQDEGSKWPERLIFSHWNKKVSVRTQTHRLDDQGKLYNMTNDPGQRKDISSEEPKLAKRLRQAVKEWKAEQLPQLQKSERPFTVGYREFPVTHLPARDGVPHGNVKRSAQAPNCSFMENWTNKDDRITWDIAVNTPGNYEATIYYTCKKENVGCEVELSLGDANVTTEITKAHDPPLYGMKEDRTDRGSESYVKDFKPLVMGEFQLPKGRGELTLRAVKVPGDGVVDVRYVVLRLLD